MTMLRIGNIEYVAIAYLENLVERIRIVFGDSMFDASPQICYNWLVGDRDVPPEAAQELVNKCLDRATKTN
jgi:hypothetical protein